MPNVKKLNTRVKKFYIFHPEKQSQISGNSTLIQVFHEPESGVKTVQRLGH